MPLWLRRYGPFWVATTLIFVSAVTGNYAGYISYRHNHSASTSPMDTWYYDINKVSRQVPVMSTGLPLLAGQLSDILLNAGRLLRHPLLRIRGRDRVSAVRRAALGLQGQHQSGADLVRVR